MIRFDRTGIELLGSVGLEWGTLGLGALALLIASPSARKGARSLAVAAMAGGMRAAQSISNFGGQIRQEMTQGMSQARFGQAEPTPEVSQAAH